MAMNFTAQALELGQTRVGRADEVQTVQRMALSIGLCQGADVSWSLDPSSFSAFFNKL